jgi:hypothetical protein
VRWRWATVLFDKVVQFNGFDPGADRLWVLFPDKMPTRLMQVENAEGLSLVSSNPGVAFPQDVPARITRQTQEFRIVGGVHGNAKIRAVGFEGRIHARLFWGTVVTHRLSVPVSFRL